MTLTEELHQGAEALALDLSPAQGVLLAHYLELLDKWNKVYNLTAVRESERMVAYHVLDSLAALPFVLGKKVLDVGSGGGMPGIPFAIAHPDLAVTVLDANHKKTTFLRQAVMELGLENVTVVCERVEAYCPDALFSTVTSRAFAELAEFVNLTRHLVATQGQWLALKGVYPYEEIELLPAYTRVAAVHKLAVPGLEAERHVVSLVAV